MHGLTYVLWIITEEEQRTVLCSTLSEILESACLNKTQVFHLATLPHAKTTDSSDITDSHPEPESSQPTDTQSKKISKSHSPMLYRYWTGDLHDPTQAQHASINLGRCVFLLTGNLQKKFSGLLCLVKCVCVFAWCVCSCFGCWGAWLWEFSQHHTVSAETLSTPRHLCFSFLMSSLAYPFLLLVLQICKFLAEISSSAEATHFTMK